MYKNWFHRLFLLAMIFGVMLPGVIDGWMDGFVIVTCCFFTAIAVYPSDKL